MPKISALTPTVIGKIRSSTIITSLAEVVGELVCNSIDAGASSILVHTDSSTAAMRVEDNGSGIGREDIKVIGERHATSKIHTIEELVAGPGTLGFRGEAISSLCDISVVEITSRSKDSAMTFSKLFKGGTVLSVGIAGHPLKSAGTVVSVRDLFYNQPVRRRVLLAGLSKQPQNVKERVYRIALMHPGISFEVIDSLRQVVVLNLQSSESALKRIQCAFGEPVSQTLARVECNRERYGMTGFLTGGLSDGQTSKGLQYFYINRRFVQKTPVHKLINSYFKTCFSAAQEGVEKVRGASSARKQTHPAFVLELTCPLSEYDITFEASKTMVEFNDWAPVLAFVRGILAVQWGQTPQEKLFPSATEQANVGAPSSSTGQKRSRPVQEVEWNLSPTPKKARNQEAYDCEGDFVTIQDSNDLRGKHNKDDFMKQTEWTHHGTDRNPRVVENVPSHRRHSLDSLEHFSYSPGGRTRFEERDSPQKGGPRKERLVDPEPVLCNRILEIETSEESHGGYGVVTFPPLEDVVGEREQASPACPRVRVAMRHPRVEAEHSGSSSALGQTRSLRFVECSEERSEEGSLPVFPSALELSRATEPPYTGRSRRQSFQIQGSNPPAEPPGGFPSAREIIGVSTSSSGEDRTCRLADFSDSDVRILGGREAQQQETSSLSFRPERNHLYSDDAVSEDHRGMKCREEMLEEGLFDHRVQSEDLPVPKTVPGGISGGREPNHDNLFRSRSPECHFPADFEIPTAGVREQGRQPQQSEPEYCARKQHETVGVGVCDEEQRGNGGVWEKEGGSGKASRSYQRGYGRALELDCYWLPQNSQQVLRRSVSAPPFHRGRNRHGVHGNPLASLVSPAVLRRDVENTRRPRLEPVIFDAAGTGGQCRAGLGETGAEKERSPVDGNRVQHQSTSPSQLPSTDKQKNNIPKPPTLPTLATRDPPPETPPSPGPKKHETEAEQPAANHTACQQNTAEQECTVEVQACGHVDPDPDPQPDPDPDLDHDPGPVHGSQEGCCHSKWRGGEGDGKGGGSEEPLNVASMYQKWQNPCMRLEEASILDLASISGPSCSQLVPGSMTREALQDAVVMQQVDKKFIPIVASDILLIVDQHAADERVRLEELRAQVLNPACNHKALALEKAEEVFISFCEEQAVVAYQLQIEFWGWRYKLVSHAAQNQIRNKSDAVAGTECSKLRITAVPNLLEVKLSGTDLVEFIRQLMETDGVSTIPPKVVRLLNSKACRGAIMFGDQLQTWECRQVVEELKQQRLCFQCAHGRPTMIPIVSLAALRERFQFSDVTTPSPSICVKALSVAQGKSSRAGCGEDNDGGFKPSTLASRAISVLGHSSQQATWSLETRDKSKRRSTRLPLAPINKSRCEERLVSAKEMM